MSLSNTYEFLFTCLLYVIGLGNIIRFPELVYANGGGVFFIPYILCLIFIGVPIFYLELTIGQYASLGPTTIWRAAPLFKGIGYGVVITSLLLAISYNVTISQAIYYFFASMQKVLPWSYCRVSSDYVCTDITIPHIDAALDFNSTASHINLEQITSKNITTPSGEHIRPFEQYFYQEFLNMSESLEDFGYPHWRRCLCLMLAWIIVFIILTQGVKSAGRVALILIPFPYIMLIAFLIQSFVVDKPGATDGIRYLFTPRWEYLAKPSLWYDALSQVFYSLSLMQGGLITLSSYNKFHHNIYRAAMLIPVLDTLTSMIAACTTFSVLGVMASRQNTNISEVIRGSTGTAFISFSEAVLMMPLPQLWSTLFFFMVVCLGLGTQYVLVETGVSAILDENPERLGKKRIRLIGWVCIILFLLGLPLICPGGVYLQVLLDEFTSSYATFFLALVFNLVFVWIYGIRRLSINTQAMLGNELPIPWKVIWAIVTPLTLLIMLLLSLSSYKPLKVVTFITEYQFPTWANLLGWLVSTVQIIPLFASAVLLYATSPKAPVKKKLQKLSKSSIEWGPALEENRLEMDCTATVSKRVYDRSSSVKVGKDIGGLDSIFSATVGNNVVVKMATSLKGRPSEDLQRNGTSKIKYSPSADLLAKRMDTNGGPIIFQEDGETYMLVPKRKNRPPGVDRSTQTDFEYSARRVRHIETSFQIGESDEEEFESNIEVVINNHCRNSSRGEDIDNPVIVIESKQTQ